MKKEIKTEYFRRLPHLQPIGGKFFITFCLKDAIPKSVVQRLQEERDLRIKEILDKISSGNGELIYAEQKKYFAQYDNYLDNAKTQQHLKNSKIARIVADKIHKLNGELYDLIAYCIMPNHVHLVIDTYAQLSNTDELLPEGYKPLKDIMQRIKGGSAYEINLLIGQSGRFWQVESYDHCVRNYRELQNIINYTLQNPVKAGLVKEWQDWPFNYVNEAYL